MSLELDGGNQARIVEPLKIGSATLYRRLNKKYSLIADTRGRGRACPSCRSLIATEECDS